MKRHTITAVFDPTIPNPIGEGRRYLKDGVPLTIVEDDEGEWVRYEDVTDTQLFIEMTAELDRTKLKLDDLQRQVGHLAIEKMKRQVRAARDERDEVIAERDMLESQAGQMIYHGNSVEHWHAKAMAYKKVASDNRLAFKGGMIAAMEVGASMIPIPLKPWNSDDDILLNEKYKTWSERQ